MDPTTATDAQRLQAADECHDIDPARAAGLLRQVDPAGLDGGQQPRYAYLLNHVFAEKLGLALEAWQRQQSLLNAAGDDAPLPLVRQAGAAARLAGDAAGEDQLTARLAGIAATSPVQASELIELAAASFQVPSLAGDTAGDVALRVLAPLRGAAWQHNSGLAAAAAALTNNLATDLADRPVEELPSASLRQAMAQAAELSQHFWRQAGQWVHHARAHYLRALVANALGDARLAEQQARAGLVLLANHDRDNQERVDQAFLRLELAHALATQGRATESQVERAMADALAEQFDDSGLNQWYASRVRRQQALSANAAGSGLDGANGVS